MSQRAYVNGVVVDPTTATAQPTNVYTAENKIIALDQAPDGFVPDEVIDVSGKWIIPGLIDLSCQFSQLRRDRIEREVALAVNSGIRHLCLQPNTSPELDQVAMVDLVLNRTSACQHGRVYPIGALSMDQDQDKMSDLYCLMEAGCIAIGNGNKPIRNTALLRHSLEYAASLNILIIYHPREHWLSENTVMHEGRVSTRLGLKGYPTAAEIIDLTRLLALVELTGAKVHVSRITCQESVKLIAQAKDKGLPVTADVAIHHLFLTDMDCLEFNSYCHVLPPLRSMEDREALQQGVLDGTIDAICSDHRAIKPEHKQQPFAATMPGYCAFPTLLPLVLRLITSNFSLPMAIAKVTREPANILGLNLGNIAVGTEVDFCIVDPEATWEVNSTNGVPCSPFQGWEMKAKILQESP